MLLAAPADDMHCDHMQHSHVQCCCAAMTCYYCNNMLAYVYVPSSTGGEYMQQRAILKLGPSCPAARRMKTMN
eukprot:7955692-Pyramimonas_sp.AAC.1